MDRPAIGPVLVGRVLVTAPTDAGIGEEDIDRPEMPLRFGDQMADLRLLANVAGDGDALDVLGDGFEPPRVSVGDDDTLGALLRVATRDRLSDSSRRARDDADLVLHLHLLLLSRGWERGSPEPLMGCSKPKEERLWRAALPGMPSSAPALLDELDVFGLGRLAGRRLMTVIAHRAIGNLLDDILL